MYRRPPGSSRSCARSSDRHTLIDAPVQLLSLRLVALFPRLTNTNTLSQSLPVLHILWRLHPKCAQFRIQRSTHRIEKRNAFLVLIITTASALATTILPRPQAADCFRRPSILQAFDLPAIKTPPAIVEDKQLPSIGHDISRPSSSSTVASYTQQRHGSHASIQLPALSTLASVASNRPNSPAANYTNNESNSNTTRETPERKMPSPPRYVGEPPLQPE